MKIINLINFPSDYGKNIIYKDYISYDQPIRKGIVNLVNGVENTIAMFSETMEIDFMSNKLDDHIFWCYSKEESFNKNHNFMNSFISDAPEIFVSLYGNKHIEISNHKEIYNKDYEYVYISNKYIFYGYFENTIYIANLLLWHYFGLDVKTILNKLNNKNIFHDKNNLKYKKYFHLFDSHLTEKIILLTELNP